MGDGAAVVGGCGCEMEKNGFRDPLHESPRRVHLRNRAVCSVANTRNGYGYSCDYCCVVRLASHPALQRTLTARCVLRIPSALSISASSYE
jgi:hypothetical protein